MPRRAIAAIAGTVTGLALLLSFKTPSRPSAAAPTTVPSTSPTTPGAFPQPGDDGPFDDGDGGPGGFPPQTQPTTPNTTPAAGGTVTYKDGTQDGAVVPTEFGDVQVQVTTSGGRITDVTALATPYDRRRSEEINRYATPVLHDEVLAAQSSQIDTVSGATITSVAYAQSLQAALDALGS